MDDEPGSALKALSGGQQTKLAMLGESDAPRTPGIYALWHQHELLYVGIARQDPAKTTNPQAAGVRGRLSTYQRARLTSDFTVSALLRFVVPQLATDELANLTSGRIGAREIQALTKAWVNENVRFSACSTTPETAVAAERVARRDGLGSTPPPSFNPLR